MVSQGPSFATRHPEIRHIDDSCPSGYFDEEVPYIYDAFESYIPPEALAPIAHYNDKIDIFSLSVLMLEIATQHPPSCGLSGIGRIPEIDRRGNDLSFLPEDHPLKPIILQCLRDDPGERPESGTVLKMLSKGEILVWLLCAVL